MTGQTRLVNENLLTPSDQLALISTQALNGKLLFEVYKDTSICAHPLDAYIMVQALMHHNMRPKKTKG